MTNITEDEELEQLWEGLPAASQLSILAADRAAQELGEHPERKRWLKIGAGLADVRAEALRLANTESLQHPTYRKYHRLILSKVPALAEREKKDHSSCQNAVWMFNNWQEVEGFLSKIDDMMVHNRLNNPTTIKRHYDAHKPKPTISERQARPAAERQTRETIAQPVSGEEVKKQPVAKSEPDIDPSTLSMTAQQKLDAAIRQHTRKLDIEFNYRVQQAARKLAEETMIPHWVMRYEELQNVIKNRKAILTRKEFNLLRKVVSSDHVQTILDPEWIKQYDEATIIVRKLEKHLLDEKESPTDSPPLPKTYAEWAARKAQVDAERKTKRDAKKANGSKHP